MNILSVSTNWIACNGLAKHYSPTSDKRATTLASL